MNNNNTSGSDKTSVLSDVLANAKDAVSSNKPSDVVSDKTPSLSEEQIKNEISSMPYLKEVLEKVMEEKREGDISKQVLLVMDEVKQKNLPVAKEEALLKAFNNIVDATSSRGDVEKCKTIMNTLLAGVVDEFNTDDSRVKENNKRGNIGFIVNKYGQDGLEKRQEFLDYMKKEFGLREEETLSMNTESFSERFNAFKNKAQISTNNQEGTKKQYNRATTSIDPNTFSKKIDLSAFMKNK